MTTLNFNIQPSFTELLYDGLNIDLHNEYVWSKSERIDQNLKLIFYRRNESYVNLKNPEWLCILVKGVKNIWTKDHNEDYPKEHLDEDSNTPDLFGYSYTGDSIMEGPTDYNQSKPELTTLIFTTVTGKALKVEGISAEINLMKKL